MDDVINILHRTYEVYMQINTDRKSQRTTVGQKARQADHLAWSEDPPFLRELYSLFPKLLSLPLNYFNTLIMYQRFQFHHFGKNTEI
uniref:SFRICE_040701 n=1 Tax=Spodoptera frugiperda TaxID=7108 RepID=A0A2H1WWD8_SPOFR